MERIRPIAIPWVFAMLVTAAYIAILAWALLSGTMPADRLTVVASGGQAAQGAIPDALAGVIVKVEGYVAQVSVQAPLGLVTVLTKLLWGVAGAVILYQMYRLTQAIAQGDPFGRRNEMRLSRSGWVLIAAETISTAATLAQDFYVRSLAESRLWHLSTDSERDPYLIIAGLLLIALGRAFKSGRKLKRAAELTI